MKPELAKIAELFGSGDIVIESDDVSKPVKYGKTASESVTIGRACFETGQHQLAILHFQKAVEQAPENEKEVFICELAGAYALIDQLPKAYRQYLQIVKSDESHTTSEPYLGLAEIYHRSGRNRDAIDRLSHAIDFEPNNPDLHIKLGEILRETGHNERAYLEVKKALELKPDEAYFNLLGGEILLSLDEPSKALGYFRAAVELSPGDDYYYLRTSIAFWRAGKRPEAIRSIRLASELDPDKNLYHGLLEALLTEMNLVAEADQESSRADQMDDYDHNRLKKVLTEMGVGEV